MKSIETRALAIDDYLALVSLWHKVEGVEIAEGDAEADLGRFLRRNERLSRVAVENNEVIGAALCGHDGRRGFIYHLAVAPSHRGRGIAKQLVDECVNGLRAAGIARAIILVAATNAIGRSFWERNGWELIGGAVPMTREV